MLFLFFFWTTLMLFLSKLFQVFLVDDNAKSVNFSCNVFLIFLLQLFVRIMCVFIRIMCMFIWVVFLIYKRYNMSSFPNL